MLEAALLCFAEQGYAASSTREIARRAGVAEATIFRHFASKPDLLLRLLRPLAHRMILPAIDDSKDLIIAASDDIEELVRRMMTLRLGFADQHAPIVRILLQELPVNPAVQQLVQEGLATTLTALADRVIAREVAAGRIRPIPTHRLLRLLASAMIGYWVTRSMIAPGDWDDAAEIDAMATIFAQGLRPSSV